MRTAVTDPAIGLCCRLQVREACNFEGFATRRIQSALRLAAYDERSRLVKMCFRLQNPTDDIE